MRSLLVVALLLATAACQKKKADPAPAETDRNRMAFAILATHDDQQPGWTFLDALSRGGVAFKIGLHGARASIAVDDRAAGKQLVEELAKALEAQVPAAGPEGTIGPLKIWSAEIPSELPWKSTIWTADAGSSNDGSVYLNLDVDHRRGELAFKSPDDSARFLAALAASVRDGR